MALRAVVFDLDGTLSTLEVDFSRLRSELGMGPGPLWESILRLTGPQRDRAEQVLLEAELAGARRSRIVAGASELLAELGRRGIPRGILTRNCRAAVEVTLARHRLEVDAVLSREDGFMKPDPGGVIELARRFGTAARETLVVGDYRFDLEAGRRAGAPTVLFWPKPDLPDYAGLADFVIRSLPEVLGILDDRHEAGGASEGGPPSARE